MAKAKSTINAKKDEGKKKSKEKFNFEPKKICRARRELGNKPPRNIRKGGMIYCFFGKKILFGNFGVGNGYWAIFRF